MSLSSDRPGEGQFYPACCSDYLNLIHCLCETMHLAPGCGIKAGVTPMIASLYVVDIVTRLVTGRAVDIELQLIEDGARR